MPPKRSVFPQEQQQRQPTGGLTSPNPTTMINTTTTAKRKKSSSSPGLLHTVGMRLSGSNLVLVLLLIFLLYAYWDSHQLYHLIDGQQEFNVVVNRVVDGDTFVGTIQDTYGEGDAVPMAMLGSGEVCVPAPCLGSTTGQEGVEGSAGGQCCRSTRLVVKGGLTAWFRLRRIDAPELPSPTRPDTQPFALEAKSALEGLLFRGEPLLPAEHSANQMMLQAAYLLDHPILPSSPPTSPTPSSSVPKNDQEEPPTKMSRSELARSQFITLERWGGNTDSVRVEEGEAAVDSAAYKEKKSKKGHPNHHHPKHQQEQFSVHSKGITVSLRIIEQDKSGRYVVDAFVHTSPLNSVSSGMGRLWVSHEMVRAGLAWGYASSPSPSSSVKEPASSSSLSSNLQISVAEVFMEPLVVAMSAARREGRGIWSTAQATEPWRWRIESAAEAEARDLKNRQPRRSGGGTSKDREDSTDVERITGRNQRDAASSERSQHKVKSKRGGRWDRRPTY